MRSAEAVGRCPDWSKGWAYEQVIPLIEYVSEAFARNIERF
jgi:hypothetical protein